MELRKASEVKTNGMYTDSNIAEAIDDAMNQKRTSVTLNVDYISGNQIHNLKLLEYDLDNRGGRLEISWQYAKTPIKLYN